MPTAEWMKKYEAVREKLSFKLDLDAYFTEKTIGDMPVEMLDIGTVHFPGGQIFACDPLVELGDPRRFCSVSLPGLIRSGSALYPVKNTATAMPA